MSVSKIFEKAAPFLALLAVLATLWVVAAAVVATDQHVSSAYQRATANEPEQEGPAVAHGNAEERIADYTLVLTALTGLLAAATVGLIWATHRLGERADHGMRVLERAYIYPVLNDANPDDGPSRRLDMIFSAPTADEERAMSLPFLFKNMGKTPGVILAVEADLRYEGKLFNVTRHYVTSPILGEGESSNELIARGMLFPREAAFILVGDVEQTRETSPDGILIFQGYVNYSDVFGEEHHEPFVWRYLRRPRRFVPVLQPHHKPKR